MKKTAISSVAALAIASSALSSDHDNVLVIQIAGEASGIVEIELLPDIAPQHVSRIKELTTEGQYDGVVFHRVIEGFMAQTGDVRFGNRNSGNLMRAGTGGSDKPDLPAEFSSVPYVKGVVGMARSQDPNSANSQFFIMFNEAPFLNGEYTVLGRVISGQEVIDQIKRGAPEANGAVRENPDYMASVRLKSAE